MALPGVLTTELFDYDPLWTPTKEAAVDLEGKQVVTKDPPKTTLPRGGWLETTEIITAAYGQATNTDLASVLEAASLGAFDGIREDVIKDDSILTSAEAQEKAAGELAIKSQVPYTFTHETTQYGFLPGQVQRVVYAAIGFDQKLLVNEIGGQTQNGKVVYSVNDGTQPKKRPGEMLRIALKAGVPRTPSPVTAVLNP